MPTPPTGCPRCGGGGWIDAFDRGCKQGDFHAKCVCRLCNGTGQIEQVGSWFQCGTCQGKGGLGCLGPCGETSMHFQSLCGSCEGRGWRRGAPNCPNCGGGGWIDQWGSGCQQSGMHAKAPCRFCLGAGHIPNLHQWRACQACDGKGGVGKWGPEKEHSVLFKSLCQVCEGRAHIQDPLSVGPANAGGPDVGAASDIGGTQSAVQPNNVVGFGPSAAQPVAQPDNVVGFGPSAAQALHGLELSGGTCAPAAPTAPSLHPPVGAVLAQPKPMQPQAAAAPASSATEDDSMLCVICLNDRKNVMVEPCAHLCVCRTCADADGGLNECPLCRGPVQTLRTIYL